MNCEQVQARLSEYLENSLDAATGASLESHISSCSQCRLEADILAACIKRIGALPQVEPPIGFAQRIITHMREIEVKSSLWDRLFVPSRTKLTIQATALILIGILGLHLFQRDPWHKRLLPPPDSVANLDANNERNRTASLESQTTDIHHEATSSAARSADKWVREPSTESDRRAGGSAKDSRSSTESRRNQAADQRQEPLFAKDSQEIQASERELRAAQQGLAPNAPGALGTGSETSSQPVRRLAKPTVRAPLPVVSESQGRSRAPGSVPPTVEMMRGGAPIPLPSEIQRLPALPDAELIIRRRLQASSLERRESVGAAQTSAERMSAAREQRSASIDLLLRNIPEISIPQILWLGIPQSQYEQLKKQLLTLGTIESESRRFARDQDPASTSDLQLRVMLIVLPPADAETAQPAPPGQ